MGGGLIDSQECATFMWDHQHSYWHCLSTKRNWKRCIVLAFMRSIMGFAQIMQE